ncbi:biotin--[acetyl-CoA-carboxylase] ligase [Frigoribacterium sp. PvP032]|uniref:biotin--[acetyl-CoA-carboxylase] ligase n=1 Tax=Frigoribacterium sp. PvP032 TaxID=2806589 RepID=UPI001AE72B05|nr:biotin--[acetyl-CoA-carboxylase] ligase [Frigoribacterium sp. PvP032]MBP1190229.1 BirA family biotin operon repressor/biotin-[acetyl-CoA-carboxylase] ligase [Frigoribacterium sp. PvP032]
MTDRTSPSFPLSAARSPRLELVAETGSTNADLLADASAPHLAVLATMSQTAGRGRLGRVWTAPPGRTLAASVLVERRGLPVESLGWLPLAAGVAMRASIAAVVPAGEVGLKWPNDVQVDGLKACGILAQARDDGSAVVVGAGVNLALTRDELPTPVSTSLSLHGAEGTTGEVADLVLSAWLAEVVALVEALAAAGGDADASGLRARVLDDCTTLGREVRVELPSGEVLTGTASSIDHEGRLVVEPPTGGAVAVSSGDVTHLRYE